MESFTDKLGSVGYCLMNARLSDRRYLAAELPKQGANLSLYTFSVEEGACEGALSGRTVALGARQRPSSMWRPVVAA